jgi:hypothetical protein
MTARRRRRLVATTIGIVVVLLALVAWIVTHQQDSAGAHGAAVDYALAITPSQQQATSTGGVR